MSHTPPTDSVTELRLNDMGARLERIETKLDEHLVRTTRAEADIGWIKGHLRLSLTAALAVIGYLGSILSRYILK